MAASNGYRPQQASDLYITSGTTRDFMYGVYRIFSYTFEMSVVDYPDDSKIASETGRNKAAVLYLAERAWCPLASSARPCGGARCGAFDDDLEVGRGWTVEPGRHRHGDERQVQPCEPGRHLVEWHQAAWNRAVRGARRS